MRFLREFNSHLPFKVAVAGRKRNVLFGIMDPLFVRTTYNDVIASSFGPITIDSSKAPERWLSYAFHNILNFYQNSPLGQYMAENSRSGSTFIDVGANLGVYALIARSHGYKTYLVEPEPSHAAFLTRNTDVYGRILAVALSDRPGTLPLYYEAQNSGSTSLVPADGYAQGTDGVAVRTFSDMVVEGAFGDPKDIHLMKVDVEGAEGRMIEGMRDFLDSGHRPVIWSEVRGDLSGRAPGTYRTVTNILKAYGYMVSEFVSGRREKPQDSDLANRGVYDLLFEP